MENLNKLSPSNLEKYSVYIHVPFCRKRCSYCDFNTVAGQASLIPTYVDALCTEIVKTTANYSGKSTVHTIFFGGGTPTLLQPQQVEKILNTIKNVFDIQPDAEITLEGNPGTVTSESLYAYSALGVNRLSLGSQSANEHELVLLGRIHDHQQTIESVSQAQQAGIHNINLDLIFGLPTQTLDDWITTLQKTIDLHPTHLSLYALKVEDGTPLKNQIHQGQFPEPDPDVAADMYDFACEFLNAVGYAQYEISNWALSTPDHRCQSRHNRQYWKNLPYFGFGAGAHALLEETRLINEQDISAYITACKREYPLNKPLSPATIDASPRSNADAMDDHMILGLRLTDEGVSFQEFQSRFGTRLEDRYQDEISLLLSQKLIEYCNDQQSIRLTPHGRLLGNQVFYHFLKDQ